MSRQMYVPKEKKDTNKINVNVSFVNIPSNTHKFGALNNKSIKFEDKRLKKPKYKKDYASDYS